MISQIMPRLLCLAVYIQTFLYQIFLFQGVSVSVYFALVYIPMQVGTYKRDHPTKHFLSPYQPHILDSNGVRNTSFWSEGPKNHLSLKILASKFVAIRL